MLTKCLSRCQSTPFINSAVVGALGCIRQNLKETFSQMTCDLDDHLNMNIVAICLQIECNKNRRVVCIKCMISSDHIEHALSFLIIQDALNSQKELNRLLRFLTDFSTGTIDDPEGQIEWLYDVLILGGSSQYPQFDDLLSNFQKEIYDNLLEIRSQFEQELEKSHRTVSSIQGKSPNQKEKLWRFKRDVNQIIKQNNQKIKNKFNKIFLQETISEQRSFDNFQFSQDSKPNLNQSHKQLNFLSLSQEFPITPNQQQQTSTTPNKLQTLSSPRQQQELTSLKSYQQAQSIGQQINEDIEDESTIQEEQEQQINLPCFSFIQEAPPQKFPYFNKRKSVTFNEGGKLINLQSGTRIISNIAFDQGNIEIRIKILSQILGCVHIGIIEQTIFKHLQPQADETAGIWCCLHPCNCTVQSNMQNSVHFLTLSPQSIIGINLNFTNDQISVKQYTHQNIITLYNKHGSLMKQKQLLFIKSDQPVQIELIN